MQDLSPTLAAIAVLGILPLLLWAEAFWRGSSRIRFLTTLLLVFWYCAIVMVLLPELLCEGSVLNSLSNCWGPLGPEALMRFLVVGPALPLILLIYLGSVVARILRSKPK
jgi:hypothetical protein